MWPYPWTHVGTPSHLGHMDRVAATMPSQAHAGAAQEAPDIGQWEGQDVPLVRPSSCNVKGGIPSSRRYLPTYLGVVRGHVHQGPLPGDLPWALELVALQGARQHPCLPLPRTHEAVPVGTLGRMVPAVPLLTAPQGRGRHRSGHGPQRRIGRCRRRARRRRHT